MLLMDQAPPLGLGIAIRLLINEGPYAIWRPLERSLWLGDERLGRPGFVSLSFRIRRWIGDRNSVNHGQ